MKRLRMKGIAKGGNGEKQKGKDDVKVSYPVPSTEHVAFIIQAEKYRKTAKMFHLHGGDLETTLHLYEKALDILVINECCDGQYFGKVVFEYGIVLTNANRHCEAAKCFLHADTLGIDRDKYYGNDD